MRSLGGACCGGTRSRDSAKRESLYQSASNTIKAQTEGRAKTSKIRAELFFCRARSARAAHARRARISVLRRRSPMRFQETIEQHFRRMLVSKRFRSRERGSSHEMGAGAIVARAIARVSTETSDDERARLTTSRRRRGDRARRGFETASRRKNKCVRPQRNPLRDPSESAVQEGCARAGWEAGTESLRPLPP